MSTSVCDCCEDSNNSPCPATAPAWVTLHRWRGSATLPNDFRQLHLTPFRLRFNYGGVSQTTTVLTGDSTLADLKAALEALSNIGPGTVLVMTENGLSSSGKLREVTAWIWFVGALSGIDVPMLEVLDSAGWKTSVVRQGETGVSEIQALGGKQSVWEALGLDTYKYSNWFWRIMLVGTGDLPALTKLCLQQERRPHAEWTAPISDYPYNRMFKLDLTDIRWDDVPISQKSTLIGGTYTLTLKVGIESETVTFNWNSTASQIQTALRALPNTIAAGKIDVTGGPLNVGFITVSFTNSRNVLGLTCTSDLVGTPPTLNVTTISDGDNVSVREEQMLDYSWPCHGGEFQLTVTAALSTQTTLKVPYDVSAIDLKDALFQLTNLNSPPTGNAYDVNVSKTGPHTRYNILFANKLLYKNIPPVTVTATKLLNKPRLVISSHAHSSAQDFRAAFEPIQVGTVWKGMFRKAWGSTALRRINTSSRTHMDNPGIVPGSRVITELNCGDGVVEWHGCLNSEALPRPEQGPLKEGGGRGLGAEASMNADGTVSVEAGPPLEFVLQVQCLACKFASNFSLWGVHEQSLLQYRIIYDRREPVMYNPASGNRCGYTGCANLAMRDNNIPFVERFVYGPDGYDAHVINDAFYASGAVKARNPVCPPDVAVFSQGYWLEVNWSRPYPPYECSSTDAPFLSPYVMPPTLKRGCDTWKHEFVREHPTTNIERLKAIYGTSVSFWGAWIDIEHTLKPGTNNKIKCLFDKYDLSKIKVLYLGGLPIGPPRNRNDFDARKNFYGFKTWEYYAHQEQLEKIVNFPFETHALDPLKRWLSQDGKVLVLDGGKFPTQFLTEMGISTTVENFTECGPSFSTPVGTISPNTLNGSLHTTPVWGPGPLNFNVGERPNLYAEIEQVADPVTGINQTDKIDLAQNGVPVLGGTYTLTMTLNGFTRTTADIQYNASTPEIRAALLAMTNILPGDDFIVSRYGWFGGPQHSVLFPIYISYVGNFSGNPQGLVQVLSNFDAVGKQKFDLDFAPLRVEPSKHPFTTGVLPAMNSDGTYNDVPDFTIDTSNIAGGPRLVTHTNRGLINISQKFEWENHIYSYEANSDKWPGGVRSYTTALPLVRPGPNAQVLGRVKGVLLSPPYFNMSTGQWVTTVVDYPCIVVEHWKSEFKFQFDFLGTLHTTGPLPFTATAAQIKTALEALPNIGTGLNVSGGPLPGGVIVEFATSLTAGVNVPKLYIEGSDAFSARVLVEGGLNADTGVVVNEKQLLQRESSPSRIIISGANELVEPDTWGVNWGEIWMRVNDGSGKGLNHIGMDEDNDLYLIHGDLRAQPLGSIPSGFDRDCYRYPSVKWYSKDGYEWGCGLSHIASAKFLKNLLDFRETY